MQFPQLFVHWPTLSTNLSFYVMQRLLSACKDEDIERVQQLLKAKANVNSQDEVN